MYDSSPSEDLNELQLELNRLSEGFSSSLKAIKTYLPLKNQLDSNKKMSSSSMNLNAPEEFKEIVARQAQETNDSFSRINMLLASLQSREEFIQSDNDLASTLHSLKKSNEHKANCIENKVKYIHELVNRVKTDNDINMQINSNKRGTGNGFDDEYDI